MHRYFVTLCTRNRAPCFLTRSAVGPVMEDLLRIAEGHRFAVPAYCFMPDHLHALLIAEADTASLLDCVRLFKQVSAFRYRRLTGLALWQSGYFERVLRREEQTDTVARYIFENPVRAGLTRRFQDYPFSGSQQFTHEQLAELWSDVRRRV